MAMSGWRFRKENKMHFFDRKRSFPLFYEKNRNFVAVLSAVRAATYRNTKRYARLADENVGNFH